MNPTETDKPIDWRERLHSLPSGTESSPFIDRLLLAAFCLGLFFGGAFSILVFGILAGAVFPPTDSAIFFTFPFALAGNILAGIVVFRAISRRPASRCMPRLAFCSFTAPAFLLLLFVMIGSMALLLK